MPTRKSKLALAFFLDMTRNLPLLVEAPLLGAYVASSDEGKNRKCKLGILLVVASGSANASEATPPVGDFGFWSKRRIVSRVRALRALNWS